MGLFKKIKDIFYDEEIVDANPKEEKKETKKEEVKPIIQDISSSETPVRTFRSNELEEKPSTFSERELFKTEKTFDFPVFEEEDEPIRTRSKTNILELQKELEEKATYTPRREEPSKTVISEPKTTTFRPSPVISPVYGILDKNYKKEEIFEKKEPAKPYTGEKNYDYVRRKAYGTLEDELENTLTRVNSEIVENVNQLEKEIDELPKPSKNIEELLNQIEKNANVSIGELEEAAKDKMMAEEENDVAEEEDEEIVTKEEKKEEPKDVSDNTLEHDLFNLIDSMYEDKEE